MLVMYLTTTCDVTRISEQNIVYQNFGFSNAKCNEIVRRNENSDSERDGGDAMQNRKPIATVKRNDEDR